MAQVGSTQWGGEAESTVRGPRAFEGDNLIRFLGKNKQKNSWLPVEESSEAPVVGTPVAGPWAEPCVEAEARGRLGAE